MTLVYDDEVEEVLRPLFIVWLPRIVIAHHRLEDGEIQMSCCRQLSVVLLVVYQLWGYTLHGILRELLEVILSLISQNVSIRDKQDAGLLVCSSVVPVRLIQLPAYLEGRIGLSRSSSHCQQDTLMIIGYSGKHFVYGYFLIVARLTTSTSVQGTKVKLISPSIILRISHQP